MKSKSVLTGILGGVSIVVIIGVFLSTTTANISDNSTQTVLKESSSLELHNTEQELTEEESRAIKFVQEYDGSDNQGVSISEFLGQMISSRYSDDLIFDPETKLGWSAYTAPDDPGFYGVVFEFKSKADEFSFIWFVNSEDGIIYPAGGGSDEILDIVDSS